MYGIAELGKEEWGVHNFVSSFYFVLSFSGQYFY